MKSNYSFSSSITCKILKKKPIVLTSNENSFRNKPHFSESYNILKTSKQLSKIHWKLFSSKPRFKRPRHFNSKAVGEGITDKTSPNNFTHRDSNTKIQNASSEKKEKSVTIKLMELKIKKKPQDTQNSHRTIPKKNSPLSISQNFRYKSRKRFPLFKIADYQIQ